MGCVGVGGERNRAQLAKALRLGANVILLDEPTNDLDVETLRSLEEVRMGIRLSVVRYRTVISHTLHCNDTLQSARLTFRLSVLTRCL